MSSPVRTDAATDDPGPAREHLVPRHGQVRLHDGRSAAYGVPPSGRVVVVLVRSGAVRTTAGGTELTSRAGDVFLVTSPEAALTCACSDDAVLDLTWVAVPLLHAVDPGGAATRLAGPPLQLLDRPSAAAWRRTSHHLEEAVSALAEGGGRGPGRLVLAAHARLVAAVVLQLASPEPDDDRGDDRDDDRHPPAGHPDPLRRAVAHLQTNPELEITPTELAAVAGVGVRALQLAFRKHLDTTPSAYLRRIRLDRVHADLLAADPARRTVAGIAGDWGFADPSRFTARYKATYGQLPSRTLRAHV